MSGNFENLLKNLDLVGLVNAAGSTAQARRRQARGDVEEARESSLTEIQGYIDDLESNIVTLNREKSEALLEKREDEAKRIDDKMAELETKVKYYKEKKGEIERQSGEIIIQLGV